LIKNGIFINIVAIRCQILITKCTKIETPHPLGAFGLDLCAVKNFPYFKPCSGDAMPTSPVERLVGSSSRRVETMATTDHRHHRTCSGTNGSSSNVLPPRLCLLVHVVVQDVMCAVTDVVTRRFIGEMALYRLIIVVHRLLGTTSVIVEPNLA